MDGMNLGSGKDPRQVSLLLVEADKMDHHECPHVVQKRPEKASSRTRTGEPAN